MTQKLGQISKIRPDVP